MYRFFVDENQIRDHKVHITGGDVNHIRNVLRLKPGDEVCVSDGGKMEYHCGILEFPEGEVLLEVQYMQEEKLELGSHIYLFQGLPKSDKMDTIVQKAVELGVYQIIPVAMKRCVVRLDQKKEESRRRRWNSISESAAKQAGRMIVPEVRPLMTFEEAVAYAADCDVRLMPYEMAGGMKETKELLAGIRKGQSVAVFIGPEGGFAGEEAELARKSGMKLITLGKRILRTETAGMTTLSILMFLLEE
ncbi:16S rRNA (uracil(1498)-N(3))-methyltransferase [Ruminococcus gauvreauii]|uniref:16S rRNA (uracil(1498)-N(3))-methyltransferase n=1 Tax=Ruminococcus gauvreauii TaxID=438033 RepID=UPI003983E480